MRVAILLLGILASGLAACDTPPIKITYRVSDGPDQSCGSASCSDVSLGCDAVINIRILSPRDPTAPYLSLCEPVPPNRNRDLCSISSIDLANMPLELPKETLEVQIVIWPRDLIEDPDTGELDCRKHEVEFDAAAGFPIAPAPPAPTPALGGHAYYHPGDSETTVTLGCTDLSSVNACDIVSTIDVASIIYGFENIGLPFAINMASRLSVSVGQPTSMLVGAEVVYALSPADTRTLIVGGTTTAVWRGEVDLTIDSSVCVQVLEDGAQTTATVTCKLVTPPVIRLTDLVGHQLPKSTLDQVLAALQLAAFPAKGLTLGIVLDANFNPRPGVVVDPSMGSVRYLSADRASVGGTMTSTSGLFVSQDAPYGTQFSAPGTTTEIGGAIQGKVTTVVLQTL